MKQAVLFLFLFSSLMLHAQDTTEIFRTYYGYRTCVIHYPHDTLEESYYPNGKLFSRAPAFPGIAPYEVSHYHRNGKKMMVMQMKNGQPQGETVIYDNKGTRIVTLTYDSGQPVDTLVHSLKYAIVFGRYTYYSHVSGGAINEDGTSNVSEHSGPGAFAEFKLIPKEEPRADIKSSELDFVTNAQGWFVLLLPRERNAYGILQKNDQSAKLDVDGFVPESRIVQSGSESWSITQPIITTPLTSLILTELKSRFMGYAP